MFIFVFGIFFCQHVVSQQDCIFVTIVLYSYLQDTSSFWRLFWDVGRLTSEDGSDLELLSQSFFDSKKGGSLLSRVKILRQGQGRKSGSILAWSMFLVYWIALLKDVYCSHLCFILMFRACKAFSLRGKEVFDQAFYVYYGEFFRPIFVSTWFIVGCCALFILGSWGGIVSPWAGSLFYLWE